MKKIIFSAFIVSMAIVVNAQDIPERKSNKPGMHHKMDRKKGNRMDLQKLNLTEDQKEKLKVQRESMHSQMVDLKKDNNITVGEQKAKMEAIRKENKVKMESIFTAEQKAQLNLMKKEKIQQQKEMAKKKSEKMQSTLNLTDAQKVQMDKNRADLQLKMKAIKEDKNLTDQQKREKGMELRRSQKESMKSILTEDQIQKMKESMHKRPGGHDGERKRPVKKENV